MTDGSSPTIYVEDEALRQGFTIIPNAILRRPDLSPGAKLTYMMLLSYAWQEGSCFPGQERLAEDMGVTSRSVITYLKQLQTAGLLVVKRRGLGLTNVYLLPRFISASENISVQGGSENTSHQEVKRSAPLEVQNFQREKDSGKNHSGRQGTYIRKKDRQTFSEDERLEKIRRSAKGAGMDLSQFEG
jgi:hypothetical protein